MLSRLIAFPLLLGAAACATAGNSTRSVLSPQNGPKAKVYVSYHGGFANRTVRTSFKTDKNAHVIVGRLGGDGRIAILYPESPTDGTLIRGATTYQARTFATNYDGNPQRYSYASSSPRSYAARVDSYDGRGNGFIFIIATENPMFTELLDDHGSWSDSLEVDDYYSSYDPRYAIRDLAETLTRGMPYSLDYADSFSTLAYLSYADGAMSCGGGAFNGFGYGNSGGFIPAFGWWTGSGFDSFAWYFLRPPMFYTNGYTSLNACSYNRYYGFVRFGDYYAFNTGWSRGPVYIPRIAPSLNPPINPEKSLDLSPARRPGFRSGFEAGPTISTARPQVNRPDKGATTRWAPPIQGTYATPDRPDRTHRPSAPGSGFTPARTYANTRNEGTATRNSSTVSSPKAPSAAPATTAARPAPAPAPKASTPATTATATATKKS